MKRRHPRGGGGGERRRAFSHPVLRAEVVFGSDLRPRTCPQGLHALDARQRSESGRHGIATLIALGALLLLLRRRIQIDWSARNAT